MTSRAKPQCHACAHFRSPFDGPDPSAAPSCDAFPDRIPADIFANKIDHRRPIEGDHGVQWAPAEGDEFPTFAFAESVLSR